MEKYLSFENESVKWGLYLGLASVALTLGCYIIDIALLAKWWLGLTILFATVAVMVLGALARRKQLGGYISFGESVVSMMTVVAIYAFISFVFSYVLYNFIDPSLPQTVKQVTLDETQKMFESMGVDEATMEQGLQNIEQQDFSQTIGKTLQGFGIALIVGLFFSLICSLFIKKEKSIFDHA